MDPDMSDGSKDSRNAAWVGSLSALGGFAALIWAFRYITQDGSLNRWQVLGMLAVAVGIAFAVSAMLRFALAPLILAKSSTADDDAAVRARVAPIVLLIGSTAIVALALALIISFVVLAPLTGFSQIQQKIDTLLSGVFSTVLPVLATWVGTVLAFYFGSENFRQAAQNTRDVLNDQLASKKKITDVMVPYERIARLPADTADAADALPMSDVINTMSAAATRVIVFNTKNQTPIYVIRSSSPPMPDKWMTSDYKESDASKGKSIKDYLAENNNANKADAVNFRFVDENATPQVVLAMMTKEGVDDVFITKDGQKTSRVLGWVAAHDLLKQ
jgi:hypothetical protein